MEAWKFHTYPPSVILSFLQHSTLYCFPFATHSKNNGQGLYCMMKHTDYRGAFWRRLLKTRCIDTDRTTLLTNVVHRRFHLTQITQPIFWIHGLSYASSMIKFLWTFIKGTFHQLFCRWNCIYADINVLLRIVILWPTFKLFPIESLSNPDCSNLRRHFPP